LATTDAHHRFLWQSKGAGRTVALRLIGLIHLPNCIYPTHHIGGENHLGIWRFSGGASGGNYGQKKENPVHIRNLAQG
jgi:hypothetical protein